VAKVQSARRKVKQSIARRVRGRRTANQDMDFKTSSWYQNAALSINIV